MIIFESVSPKHYTKSMKNILLIDDDEIILKTYQYLLSSLNHNVTITTSSSCGLELALTHKYDLIISDYRMPDIDGLELLKKLKEGKINSDIYISTGGIDHKEMEQVNSAGATGILQKPFSISKISSLLS